MTPRPARSPRTRRFRSAAGARTARYDRYGWVALATEMEGRPPLDRQGHAARDTYPRFRSAWGPIPLRSAALDGLTLPAYGELSIQRS